MYEVKPATIPAKRRFGSGGCAFLIFAVMLSAGGFGLAFPGLRAGRWPVTAGTVIDSSVETSHTSKGGTTHACIVNYRFVVDGIHYTGNKLDALKNSTSGNQAFEDKARFAPGTPCEVHYNPDNPGESCLCTDPPGFAWVLLVIGFLCGCGAALAWGTSWWKTGVGGSG